MNMKHILLLIIGILLFSIANGQKIFKDINGEFSVDLGETSDIQAGSRTSTMYLVIDEEPFQSHELKILKNWNYLSFKVQDAVIEQFRIMGRRIQIMPGVPSEYVSQTITEIQNPGQLDMSKFTKKQLPLHYNY